MQLFTAIPASAAIVPYGYQPGLVELSCLIAIVAAYAALRTIWKIERIDSREGRLLLGASALAMGLGTWSMHFLGTLALEGPFGLALRTDLTVVSIIPAVIAAFFGLRVIAVPAASGAKVVASGLTMGLGISAMHFLGMGAMIMDVGMSHRPVRVAAAVFAAAVLATAALALVRHALSSKPGSQFRIMLVSALLLGAAVSTMHYLGMSAMRLYTLDGDVSVPAGLGERALAALVVAGTLLVCLAAVSATAIDRRLRALRASIRGRTHEIVAAVEGLSEGFIVFDAGQRIVVWNAQAETISAEVASALRPGAHYDDIALSFEHLGCKPHGTGDLRKLSVQPATVGQLLECQLPDGRWVELREKRTSAGYLVLSFTDVTAHKQAKLRLQAFFDHAPYPFLAVNADGIIVSVNHAALKVFGYSHDELIGQSCCVLVPARRREHVLRRVEQCLANPATPVPAEDAEPRGVRKNGVIFPVEVTHGVLDFDRESLVVFGVRDLTERREMEAQLLRSQKMQVVGQLTGGLAHDFNNLLTVIMGNLQLLEVSGRLDGSSREQIGDAIEAASRGSELTKRLLAFARRQLLAPKTLDINLLVNELVPLVRKTLTAEIELVTKLPEDLWPVDIDPSQLESALLNLAINGRDAMQRGGKFVIETRNVTLDENFARNRAEVVPGDYVLISVTDTGTGMAPDTLEQAFEPFFTTKSGGLGNGLGLSTVYGFVKQSKGHINIYSELGYGTSVQIYLPRSTQAAASSTTFTATSSLPRVPTGDERILLVDDEDAVRRTVTQLLQRLGYAVVEAAEAKDALALLDAGEKFDLLLTDVVMPGGMSGLDLSKEVRRRHPDVKILLTSGYTDTALLARGVLGPDDHILNKPYRTAELAAKLRAVLDPPTLQDMPVPTGESPEATVRQGHSAENPA